MYLLLPRASTTSENANIDTTVYYDSTLGEWLFLVGEVSVTRGWQTAEDLFWVSQAEHNVGTGLGGTLPVDPMWIFVYLEWLKTLNSGEADQTENMEYYWDIDNNGNKLIKLRFYPM